MKTLLTLLLATLGAIAAPRVEAPSGWLRASLDIPNLLEHYTAPGGDGESFSASMMITRGKKPCCASGAVDSLGLYLKEQQSRILPRYAVTEESKRTVNGAKGYFLVTRYTRGYLDLSAMQFVYFEGKEFVSILYTCRAQEMYYRRADFEKSLATLRR